MALPTSGEARNPRYSRSFWKGLFWTALMFTLPMLSNNISERSRGFCSSTSSAVSDCTLAGTLSIGVPSAGKGVVAITSITGSSIAPAGLRVPSRSPSSAIPGEETKTRVRINNTQAACIDACVFRETTLTLIMSPCENPVADTTPCYDAARARGKGTFSFMHRWIIISSRCFPSSAERDPHHPGLAAQ